MIRHWWICGRKWSSPPLLKMKLGPPIQRLPKKFEIFPALSYKTRKRISPPLRKHLWVGGVYTMENRDTNTYYQKFVRVGNQKWEIVEITIGIFFFFFCLRFVFTIFLYSEFSSPTWKNSPPPKVPNPIQNLNLTKVPHI